MTALKILIAPCYGNPKSRRRFDTTIAEPVSLDASGPAAKLTAGQREALTALHPDGEARFWGATAAHTRAMSTLSRGDIVLFTGDNKVKAIGEVGYQFQNPAFADELWRYDEKDEDYAFIYSVTGVRLINRDKAALLSLPGFNPKDPLTGQRFVRDPQVEPIVEAFEIRSEAVERKLVEGLQERLNGSRVVPGRRTEPGRSSGRPPPRRTSSSGWKLNSWSGTPTTAVGRVRSGSAPRPAGCPTSTARPTARSRSSRRRAWPRRRRSGRPWRSCSTTRPTPRCP
ncbi:hypothetical protein ACFQV2_11380 [Actinokineospora soli]|uniref:Uncharacterized protein n=1 Tax=Actinokineospora soli TaxID=1048753 RepID=A0ABW2TM72_9PSEU